MEVPEDSKDFIKKGIVKRHKCTVKGCTAEFQKPSKLLVHMRKHSGERPYTCDECDKTYTNDSHLRRHKSVAHPPPDVKDGLKDVHPCPHEGCLRQLANVYSLRKHIQRYHNPLRKFSFECDQCNAGFFRKSQLSVHMAVHTGKPPFACESCNMGFMQRTLYTKHLSYHKTFECECSQTFTRWSHFCEHKKECKKCVKTFQCEYCNKIFQLKNKYTQHVKTHLSEIPKFYCTYDGCHRVYKYERNLRVHINRFHKKIKVKKIKCTYEGCESTFVKKQNLDYHLQLHENPYKPRFPRNRRKDAGTIKKSLALRMTGFTVPYEAEKMLIGSQAPDIYLNSDTDGIYSSDANTNVNSDTTDTEYDKNTPQKTENNSHNFAIPSTSGLQLLKQVKTNKDISNDTYLNIQEEPNKKRRKTKEENMEDSSDNISTQYISSNSDESENLQDNEPKFEEINIKNEPIEDTSDNWSESELTYNYSYDESDQSNLINEPNNMNDEPKVKIGEIRVDDMASDDLDLMTSGTEQSCDDSFSSSNQSKMEKHFFSVKKGTPQYSESEQSFYSNDEFSESSNQIKTENIEND